MKKYKILASKSFEICENGSEISRSQIAYKRKIQRCIVYVESTTDSSKRDISIKVVTVLSQKS